jgi:allophanate hydrolase subunit 1
VAVGGSQTGIYPVESPGGWRLIGRTYLTLFDPSKEIPTLMLPGDKVRFVPITEADFLSAGNRVPPGWGGRAPSAETGESRAEK